MAGTERPSARCTAKLLGFTTLILLVGGSCTLFTREPWSETAGGPWPTSGWTVSTPAAQGLSGAALDDFRRKVAAGDYGYVDRVLVVRHGYLVLDARFSNDYRAISTGRDMSDHQYNYFHPDYHPFHRGTELHTLQSVTKSVTSALIGIAIGQGGVRGPEVKMMQFFEEYTIAALDDRKRSITLGDLLTMRAGMDWHETDVPLTDPRNTTIQLEASKDWIQFSLDRPMSHVPGDVWVYNSGASQLLAAILKKATGTHVDDYAAKHLFGPLGIREFHWKKTPKGWPDTEGGLYLKAEDLAKIGYLFLRDGVWDGRRVLPDGWVEAATRRRVADVAPSNPRRDWGYGYLWWRLDEGSVVVHAGLGYGGQYLLVIPDLDIVGVLTSWNVFGRHTSPLGPFLRTLLASAPAERR